MATNLEEGDIVLCTVDRIVGTVVFVKVEENGEGSIIVSEIAPGRIRNLRDYVVPGKKIVCKILKIDENGGIYLSLRRVTLKEKKELSDQFKEEKGYVSILKSVLKEDAEKIIAEISKQSKLVDFVKESKSHPAQLEKLAGKENAEKILKILSLEKKKKAVIKKEFSIKTQKPNGITLIKSILSAAGDIEVKYLAAGKYVMKLESENIKQADQKLQQIINEMELKAKKEGVEFSVKEK
ncbi:MAG: hypothetical protein KKA64_03575 [Nanoarchaeota archaeon]|nr:hypothetical protein [Nanoarchaeota archaeon]